MKKFVQLHMLKSYPTSNLNRDDLGAPKSVNFGGTERLRISSQCLKRNYRMSFAEDERSSRTRMLPQLVLNKLIEGGVSEKDADNAITSIFRAFFMTDAKKGKSFIVNPQDKKDKDKDDDGSVKVTHQLSAITAFSGEEKNSIFEAADVLIEHGIKSTEFEDVLLSIREASRKTSSVDLASFGRMVAGNKDLDVEAAVQVAHAFTVSTSDVDDDYFTAVDDLSMSDNGSAHLDSREMGSGIFYHYMLIDTAKLATALKDEADVEDAIENLTKAFVYSEPTGYQNSFAAHSRPCCVMTEIGSYAPRSLANAFFEALPATESENEVVNKMLAYAENLNRTYSEKWETKTVSLSGDSSIDELFQAVRCAAH